MPLLQWFQKCKVYPIQEHGILFPKLLPSCLLVKTKFSLASCQERGGRGSFIVAINYKRFRVRFVMCTEVVLITVLSWKVLD